MHVKDGVTYPDTLVGTDSHTTMINGIGVVGWGVGGIEAEAGMLGQPVYFLTPDVVGVELKGRLAEGITATDLVLTVTEMLRKEKVVGKFVEFFGEGTASLAVPDRAARTRASFERMAALPGTRRARPLGTIGAIDLADDAHYLGGLGWRVFDAARKRGVYLRPLGDVVYVTPPLNIPLDDLDGHGPYDAALSGAHVARDRRRERE